MMDQVLSKYGLRTIEITPQKGFLLNGNLLNYEADACTMSEALWSRFLSESGGKENPAAKGMWI